MSTYRKFPISVTDWWSDDANVSVLLDWMMSKGKFTHPRQWLGPIRYPQRYQKEWEQMREDPNNAD